MFCTIAEGALKRFLLNEYKRLTELINRSTVYCDQHVQFLQTRGLDLWYSVPVPGCCTLALMGKDAVLVVQGKTSLHEVSLHARLRHDPQTDLLSRLAATFHDCFHPTHNNYITYFQTARLAANFKVVAFSEGG